MRSFLAFSVFAGGSLIFGGCGGGSSTPPIPVVTHFSVTAPTAETAGTSFSISVSALDSSNNMVTSYAGIVHFSSTDTQAALPANSPLTNGTGMFSVILRTAAPETIVVSDTARTTISGSSSSIQVTGLSATHFSVTAPANGSSGSSLSFTVSALDPSNNVVTSYPGIVHFTSSDAQAGLPPDSSLTNGTGTFSAVLKTVANQTITATDTVTASITGTSGTIAVGKQGPLAITSGTPPSGTFGATYGPSSTEDVSCSWRRSRSGGTGFLYCTPCDPATCKALPPCTSYFTPGYCHATRQAFLGFPLSAMGGVAPYNWSWNAAANSSVPAGLSITKGYIVGTAVSSGTYDVIVTVTDSASPPNLQTASYQIVIAPPPPPTINATPLPAIGTMNSPYVGFTFTGMSTAMPLTWSETGPLPQGMTLSAAGVLSGTPTQAGSFTITVNAQDTQGQDAPPQNFTIEVLAKGFLPTGSMQVARTLHTATLLNDGKVLVTGGVNISAFPTTAELYDPATRKFSQTTGTLSTIRVSPSATLLKSGKVLVVGGKGGDGTQLASAELYDPVSQTFAITTGSMTSTRSYHMATLLSDGTVLITGGLDLAGDGSGTPVASAEIYDPATNAFTVTGSMSTGRFFHSATLLGNGKVLIAGGLDSGTSLSTAELYDPATKTFTPAGSMSVPRIGHTATLLANGKVLLAGGGSSFGGAALAATELYDPSAGSFTPSSPMANPRSLHTATLLNNGQVLLAGGSSVFYGGGNSTSLSAAELFDPTTGAFTPTADMTALRESHTATLLQTGDVLVVGGSDGTIGYSGTTTVLSTAELYQ